MRSWSSWRRNAPAHTSTSHSRRGNETSLVPAVDVTENMWDCCPVSHGLWCLSVCTYPCPVLYITDVKLHGDVETVQEIPSKHHGVDRGVDSVNPTWAGIGQGFIEICFQYWHNCVIIYSEVILEDAHPTLHEEIHSGVSKVLFEVAIDQRVRPEGMMKVQPCFSSILWQSDARSPRKTSPCFPDSTQFS